MQIDHPAFPKLKFKLVWGDLIFERKDMLNASVYFCPCGWMSPHFNCSFIGLSDFGASIPDDVYQAIFEHALLVEGGNLAAPGESVQATEKAVYAFLHSPKTLAFHRLYVPEIPNLNFAVAATLDSMIDVKYQYCYQCQQCKWKSSYFPPNDYLPTLIQEQMEQHAKSHEEAVASMALDFGW